MTASVRRGAELTSARDSGGDAAAQGRGAPRTRGESPAPQATRGAPCEPSARQRHGARAAAGGRPVRAIRWKGAAGRERNWASLGEAGARRGRPCRPFGRPRRRRPPGRKAAPRPATWAALGKALRESPRGWGASPSGVRADAVLSGPASHPHGAFVTQETASSTACRRGDRGQGAQVTPLDSYTQPRAEPAGTGGREERGSPQVEHGSSTPRRVMSQTHPVPPAPAFRSDKTTR